jgi:hypothetical protein
MRRDLKDWCITKDLALDRREWKLAIHVSEPGSLVPSLLLPFYQVISHPFLFFLLSVLLPFLFFDLVFCRHLFSHPFFFALVLSLFHL